MFLNQNVFAEQEKKESKDKVEEKEVTKKLSTEEKREKALKILEKTIRFAPLTKRKTSIRNLTRLKKEEQKPFIPILEKLFLSDPEPSIRQIAINTIGRMKQKSSEAHLIKALEDDNISVVRETVGSLRLIKSKKAGVALAKKLKDLDATKNNQLFVSIINYLSSIKYKASADFLLKIMKDSDTNIEIKRATVLYFGRAGIKKMQSALLEILQDEDEAVGIRAYAANSLGHLEDASVIKALQDELKKIEKLPDSKSRANHNVLKTNVTLALLRLGDRSVVPHVLAQLRGDDPRQRIQAAKRVSEMKLEGAREHLEYMAKYDSNLKVQKAAKKAIEEWGKKE